MNFQNIFTFLLLSHFSTLDANRSLDAKRFLVARFVSGLAPWELNLFRILLDRKRKLENSDSPCTNSEWLKVLVEKWFLRMVVPFSIFQILYCNISRRLRTKNSSVGVFFSVWTPYYGDRKRPLWINCWKAITKISLSKIFIAPKDSL